MLNFPQNLSISSVSPPIVAPLGTASFLYYTPQTFTFRTQRALRTNNPANKKKKKLCVRQLLSSLPRPPGDIPSAPFSGAGP